MSRKSRYTVSVVEKLLEQRRLIQEWLAKLDRDAPEAMPPHVVEKVRNDYRARLQSVMAELAEHGDTVRQGVDEALQRQEELTRQQTALRDELSEARLRKQVGELDDTRFKEISARCKEGLEEIGKSLAGAVRDIERYEEILELIAQGEKKAEEPEEEEEEEEEEKAKQGVKPAASAAEASAVAAATPAAGTPKPEASKEQPVKPQMDVLDELAFLKAVTTDVKPKPAPENAGSAKPAAPAAQVGSAPSAPAATPPPSPPGPPSPRKSVVFAPKPPPSVERIPELDAAPGLITLDESSPTLRPSTAKKEAEPRRQEDAREAQEGKALVCKECGTVNLPTEWYCEKCGAELSAL